MTTGFDAAILEPAAADAEAHLAEVKASLGL
jgi:hypothetical protein